MQSKLKQILLCFALLGCCANESRASFQEPDSIYTVVDSTDSEDYVETEEEDDAEPERIVIYNQQTPSESRWLEATSDDAYSYRTTREFVGEAPKVRQESPPEWILWLLAFFRFFTTPIGKILLWGLLIAIIGYVVYRLVVGEGGLFGKRDVKPAPAPADELTAEGLMDTGWDAKMRAALAAGEQREAIRFGYLHLLQQLQGRDLIAFRADKTNISYYRELDEAYRPEFRSITRVYEFAWYGGYLPDEAGMSSYLSQLDQFLQRISR